MNKYDCPKGTHWLGGIGTAGVTIKSGCYTDKQIKEAFEMMAIDCGNFCWICSERNKDVRAAIYCKVSRDYQNRICTGILTSNPEDNLKMWNKRKEEHDRWLEANI